MPQLAIGSTVVHPRHGQLRVIGVNSATGLLKAEKPSGEVLAITQSSLEEPRESAVSKEVESATRQINEIRKKLAEQRARTVANPTAARTPRAAPPPAGARDPFSAHIPQQLANGERPPVRAEVYTLVDWKTYLRTAQKWVALCVLKSKFGVELKLYQWEMRTAKSGCTDWKVGLANLNLKNINLLRIALDAQAFAELYDIRTNWVQPRAR